MDERQGKKGLNSLSVRLSKLEDNQIEVDDNDFYTQMKQKERKKRRELMATIVMHYSVDIHNDMNTIDADNIVAIIVFSIRYVEANGRKLADYLKLDLTNEFKKNICSTFIRSFNLGYTETFIDTTIDAVHTLIYPRRIVHGTIPETIEPEVPKKKKKGLFK